jgi:thiol:disulfide interchange protein DsbD
VFVVFLAVLFFVLALNFLGLFEVGMSLTHLGGPPRETFNWSGSFLSGVLATIAATPCTAPFMGTAIGAALSLSGGMAVLIFTFLGLGMAFPFMLLSWHPQFLRFIPKPGPWMIFLKQGLGFILMGTVVWLLWVFGLQSGVNALCLLLSGMVVIGMAGWLFGKGQTSEQQRRSVYLAAVVFWILGLGISFSASKTGGPQPGAGMGYPAEGASTMGWLSFSPELVENLREQGQPFFIDFTAAWCLSCQVNDKLIFQAPEVMRAFSERNVVLIKADWTSRDDRITQALAQYGKNSIPLYVLYTGNPASDPVVLPQVLTREMVIEALSVIEKKENKK